MTHSGYLDSELLRINLELPKHVYEDKISEIVTEANQEVDVRLKPYAVSLPLDGDNIIYGQIRKAALHYARALWFNKIFEHDIEEKERVRFEDKMKPIIESFRADRNVRTRSVVAGIDPTLEKIYNPAQRDMFIDIFT